METESIHILLIRRELLRFLDYEMIKTKHQGRNQVVRFHAVREKETGLL